MIDILQHFVLSAFTGSLAFCLTSITSWLWWHRISRSRSTTYPTMEAAPPIFQLSLCSGLFFALLSHIWWDGLLHIGGIDMFMFWYIVTRLDVYIQTVMQIAAVIATVSGVWWIVWSIRDWRRNNA